MSVSRQGHSLTIPLDDFSPPFCALMKSSSQLHWFVAAYALAMYVDAQATKQLLKGKSKSEDKLCQGTFRFSQWRLLFCPASLCPVLSVEGAHTVPNICEDPLALHIWQKLRCVDTVFLWRSPKNRSHCCQTAKFELLPKYPSRKSAF